MANTPSPSQRPTCGAVAGVYPSTSFVHPRPAPKPPNANAFHFLGSVSPLSAHANIRFARTLLVNGLTGQPESRTNVSQTSFKVAEKLGDKFRPVEPVSLLSSLLQRTGPAKKWHRSEATERGRHHDCEYNSSISSSCFPCRRN